MVALALRWASAQLGQLVSRPQRPTLRETHAIALDRLARAPRPVAVKFAPTGRRPPEPVWYAPGDEPWNRTPRVTRGLICPLCGQRDGQSRFASWHPECVSLWKVAQNQSIVVFSMNDTCGLTGVRLGAKAYEVDHTTPLFHVRAQLLQVGVLDHWHRAWPFWSVFNLRPVLKDPHREHSAAQRRGEVV